jgi:serine/threonine-protein kinase
MVGQNIGKYRVEDRIGRGGMGTVFRALDETLHREVAIKVLNAELNDPEIAKRFRAEAITVARLSHPGIATIYELFQHDGQWLMVMEFVRGETLEHLVERMGALSPQRAAELCMQSLAALAHAHSMGVVHRDLKPANLMITETGSVKIMDFGIARVAGTEHLTSAGYMMGTPAYMAPEQVMGHEIDARADLYAMGVVFYRLTTARLPFKGDTPFAMAQSQVNDMPTPIGLMRTDLPPWVEQIIARALAKAPEMRFQSAVEFHEAFARCLAGLSMTSTAAMPVSPAVPTEILMTPASPTPTGAISSRFQTTSEAPTAYAPQPEIAAPIDPVAVRRAAPVPPQPKSNFNSLLPAILGFGVCAVVLAAAGFVWTTFASRGSRQAAPPAQSAAAPATPAAAISTPSPPEAPPPATAGSPPPTTPAAPAAAKAAPATPPATSTSSRGAAGPPPAAGAAPDASGRSTGAGARSTGPVPAPPAAAPPVTATPPPTAAPETRTPDPNDAQVVFPDVKVLLVNGRRAQDRDALLSFVGGQVTVLSRQGGTVIAATAYKAIERATYVRARNPKWDPLLFSPPDNLDMPGILPTAKHWLVLQSRSAYLIIQLGGNSWQKVIETVEGRTGLKVARPTSGGD